MEKFLETLQRISTNSAMMEIKIDLCYNSVKKMLSGDNVAGFYQQKLKNMEVENVSFRSTYK